MFKIFSCVSKIVLVIAKNRNKFPVFPVSWPPRAHHLVPTTIYGFGFTGAFPTCDVLNLTFRKVVT